MRTINQLTPDADVATLTNPELRDLTREGTYADDYMPLIQRATEELWRRGQVCPDGKPYFFGTVLKQYVVGERYVIVESVIDRPYHGHPPGKPNEFRLIEPHEDKRHSFSTYIDGHRSGHSFRSFDEALVHCVAYLNLKDNESTNTALNEAPRVVTYFMRMVNASKEVE